MNLIDQIADFFTRLVRGRVDSVTIGAKSKMWSAQARAKSKVANAVNQAIDSRVDRVKGKAQAKMAERKNG